MNEKSVLINVPISVGELIDKITILEIKLEQFQDQTKIANVKKELNMLIKIRNDLDLPPPLEAFVLMLKDTNNRLWNIENNKRLCEANNDFGNDFIKYSRELYINNDLRNTIKRKINDLTNSEIVEEKDYIKYRINK